MIESHRRHFSLTGYHDGNVVLFENKTQNVDGRSKKGFYFLLCIIRGPVLTQLIIRSPCSAVGIFTKSNNSYKTDVLIFWKSGLNMYVYGFLHLFDVSVNFRDSHGCKMLFLFNCLSPNFCEIVQHIFQAI